MARRKISKHRGQFFLTPLIHRGGNKKNLAGGLFMDMKIKFWGVRGSKPTPGKETIHFGGNTSCVEIKIGNRRLIFDAGTGIVELGNQMMKEKKHFNA